MSNLNDLMSQMQNMDDASFINMINNLSIETQNLIADAYIANSTINGFISSVNPGVNFTLNIVEKVYCNVCDNKIIGSKKWSCSICKINLCEKCYDKTDHGKIMLDLKTIHVYHNFTNHELILVDDEDFVREMNKNILLCEDPNINYMMKKSNDRSNNNNNKDMDINETPD